MANVRPSAKRKSDYTVQSPMKKAKSFRGPQGQAIVEHSWRNGTQYYNVWTPPLAPIASPLTTSISCREDKAMAPETERTLHKINIRRSSLPVRRLHAAYQRGPLRRSIRKAHLDVWNHRSDLLACAEFVHHTSLLEPETPVEERNDATSPLSITARGNGAQLHV